MNAFRAPGELLRMCRMHRHPSTNRGCLQGACAEADRNGDGERGLLVLLRKGRRSRGGEVEELKTGHLKMNERERGYVCLLNFVEHFMPFPGCA